MPKSYTVFDPLAIVEPSEEQCRFLSGVSGPNKISTKKTEQIIKNYFCKIVWEIQAFNIGYEQKNYSIHNFVCDVITNLKL